MYQKLSVPDSRDYPKLLELTKDDVLQLYAYFKEVYIQPYEKPQYDLRMTIICPKNIYKDIDKEDEVKKILGKAERLTGVEISAHKLESKDSYGITIIHERKENMPTAASLVLGKNAARLTINERHGEMIIKSLKDHCKELFDRKQQPVNFLFGWFAAVYIAFFTMLGVLSMMVTQKLNFIETYILMLIIMAAMMAYWYVARDAAYKRRYVLFKTRDTKTDVNNKVAYGVTWIKNNASAIAVSVAAFLIGNIALTVIRSMLHI